MANGLILWEGVSLLDGRTPIVCIATMGSKNVKTGAEVQTWIMLRDMAPTDAVACGADEAVCGSCPQRRFLGGSCYVVPFQAPLSVWKCYQRGGYRRAGWGDFARLRSMKVRAGSYGDPLACPAWVWDAVQPWTGYTHQWRTADGSEMSRWLMASVDRSADIPVARAAGWRSFSILGQDEVQPVGTVACPAQTRGVQCHDCGMCRGTARRGKDVTVRIHGALASRYQSAEV